MDDDTKRLNKGATALRNWAIKGTGIQRFFEAIRPEVGSVALVERYIVDSAGGCKEVISYETTSSFDKTTQESTLMVMRAEKLLSDGHYTACLLDKACGVKALRISECYRAPNTTNLGHVRYHLDVDHFHGWEKDKPQFQAFVLLTVKAGLRRFLAEANAAGATKAIETVVDAMTLVDTKHVMTE